MNVLFSVLLTLATPRSACAAVVLSPSPTLGLLADEAGKNPAGAPTDDGAKAGAGAAFTGEGGNGLNIQSPKPVGAIDLNGNPVPIEGGTGNSEAGGQEGQAGAPLGKVMHFKKVRRLLPGSGGNITLYTDPVEDVTGHDKADKQGPESPISPWMIYVPLAIGLAATCAGVFFPPLLFLGGLGLGVGAVLWFIDAKLSPGEPSDSN